MGNSCLLKTRDVWVSSFRYVGMPVGVGVVGMCVHSLSHCVRKMMWTAYSQAYSPTLSPSAGEKRSHWHLRLHVSFTLGHCTMNVHTITL